MSYETRVVLDRLGFAEAPRWHDDRLWVSDFYGHRVYSASPSGADLRVEAEVPQQPSGLGWLPDGRLLIVSMLDQRVLRREHTGELAIHAELGGLITGCANDMVVARDGKAYVSSFGFDMAAGDPLQPSVIVCVEPDGTAKVVADDVWFGNGMAITEKNELIVAESFGNRISMFDLRSDGSGRNRRSFAEFGPLPPTVDIASVLPALAVTPDGCCVDAEGALWVADPIHGRALRVREGGEILDVIEPGMFVFACMLGGLDGCELFLCTAADNDPVSRAAAFDATVISTRVGVPHAGRP